MITLRILTRKSKLGCGTYPNETVGRLLERKMYPALRKYYYCQEAISFTDDILDEIHAEIRIPKPGVDKDALKKVAEMMEKRRVAALFRMGKEKAALGEIAHQKADKRYREMRRNIRIHTKERLTKGDLQAANHGHTFIRVYQED